jgi:beta-lactamase superfamily II metal-dependent hydrolase
MIKVTFKNVDQGDSIILEWINDDGKRKIAIIDCNLVPGNKNPVLDYIQNIKIPEIEFLILSHPHLDHYAGFWDILEYCEQNKIPVNWFLHTSMLVPEFLQTSAKSAYANNELAKLFIKIRKLLKSEGIRNHGYVTDNAREIGLNNHIRLKFLSPSPHECDNFVKNVPLFHEEDGHNNPNSNWLSTVIKIYSEKWFILLTSDVDKSVLVRIGTKHSEELTSELLLGQSPHHGAKGNHRNSFWKTGITNRKKKTPIVFSVGNNPYGHPSYEAVDFFRTHDYAIYATNQMGSLNTIDAKDVHEISVLLDFVSKPLSMKVPNKFLNGDKVFVIKDNKLEFIE